MFMHCAITEEQKQSAKANGYLAGRSGHTSKPPQAYSYSNILMLSWLWGYSKGKRVKLLERRQPKALEHLA